MCLSLIALLTDDDSDRRTRKTKGLAQIVLQVALIGEVEELDVVAEEDEGGGRDRDLRHIVDLESLALVRGGLNLHRCLGKQLVEHARRDAGVGLIVHVIDVLKEGSDALSRDC